MTVSPAKMKPMLHLDQDKIGDEFDDLDVGQPIRLEVIGKVTGKHAEGQMDEIGSVEIEIHSVDVLGEVSEKEAEKMSDEDLDTAIEKQMDTKRKVAESEDKGE